MRFVLPILSAVILVACAIWFAVKIGAAWCEATRASPAVAELVVPFKGQPDFCGDARQQGSRCLTQAPLQPPQPNRYRFR